MADRGRHEQCIRNVQRLATSPKVRHASIEQLPCLLELASAGEGGAKGHMRDACAGLVGDAVNLERAQRTPSRRYGDVDVVNLERDPREHRPGDAGDEPLVRARGEEGSLLERLARRLRLAGETPRPAKREERDRSSDRERVAQQLGGLCGGAQHPGRVAPGKARTGQGSRSLERDAAWHRPFASGRLRRLERGQRLLAAIEHAERPCPGDGESRISLGVRPGKFLELAEDRHGVVLLERGAPVVQHQRDRALERVAGNGVTHGLVPVALRAEPLGRPSVHGKGELGIALEQLVPEHVREQLVVAIPLPAIVERYQEEVGSLELDQDLGRALPAGGRIAEMSRHRVEDRRLEQELVSLLVERVENDLGQVVDDVTAGPAKACDEAGRIGLVRQRHRRQVNADRPSFTTLVQRAQGLGGEAEVQDLVEESGRLGLGEAEVGGTKLQQLLECPQPPHRNRWIRTRRDGQCDVARRPFQEEAERVMADAIRDLLVVVEHEDELLVDCFQVMENSRDDRIDDIRARLTQRTEGGCAPFGRGVPDRLNDVAPQRDRVVVRRVERDAGEGAGVDLAPLREEGRLPEPRRRSKQDEPRRRLA